MDSQQKWMRKKKATPFFIPSHYLVVFLLFNTKNTIVIIAWFIRSAKVSISNAFAYFSILKLAYAMLM